MSKKRETIVEITKKLRCMDFNSVVVMKTAADCEFPYKSRVMAT